MAPFLTNGDTEDDRKERTKKSDLNHAVVRMRRLSIDPHDKSDAPELDVLPRIKPKWLVVSLSADVSLATWAPLQFDAETFAWALQSELPAPAVEQYLRKFDASQTFSQVNSTLQSHPLLHYAVERNHAGLVRLCLDYGADPDARTFTSMPVLPFLVLNAKRKAINATEAAKVLLARGASPDQIPKELWVDYMANPGSADFFHSSALKSGDFS